MLAKTKITKLKPSKIPLFIQKKIKIIWQVFIILFFETNFKKQKNIKVLLYNYEYLKKISIFYENYLKKPIITFFIFCFILFMIKLSIKLFFK